MIKVEDFDKNKNYCLLNEKGRVKFIQEFDNKLNEASPDPILKRDVSFKTRLRNECYKLIKHLMDEKEYTPYQISLGH